MSQCSPRLVEGDSSSCWSIQLDAKREKEKWLHISTDWIPSQTKRCVWGTFRWWKHDIENYPEDETVVRVLPWCAWGVSLSRGEPQRARKHHREARKDPKLPLHLGRSSYSSFRNFLLLASPYETCSSSTQRSQLCPIWRAHPLRNRADVSCLWTPASHFERRWQISLLLDNLQSQTLARQTTPVWTQSSAQWQRYPLCSLLLMAQTSRCWWPETQHHPALSYRRSCSCARPWRGHAACYGPPRRQQPPVLLIPGHGCHLHGPIWRTHRAHWWWSKAWRGHQMCGSKTLHSCQRWPLYLVISSHLDLGELEAGQSGKVWPWVTHCRPANHQSPCCNTAHLLGRYTELQ